jgi:transcriptional regulator with XRE-family HTH domain
MRLRTPTDIGLLIRQRRRAQHLDQAELARRVGVSRQWIIGIEKGGKVRADLNLVLRTLDALGVVLRADDSESSGASPPGRVPVVEIDDVLAAHRGRGSRDS